MQQFKLNLLTKTQLSWWKFIALVCGKTTWEFSKHLLNIYAFHLLCIPINNKIYTKLFSYETYSAYSYYSGFG